MKGMDSKGTRGEPKEPKEAVASAQASDSALALGGGSGVDTYETPAGDRMSRADWLQKAEEWEQARVIPWFLA